MTKFQNEIKRNTDLREISQIMKYVIILKLYSTILFGYSSCSVTSAARNMAIHILLKLRKKTEDNTLGYADDLI